MLHTKCQASGSEEDFQRVLTIYVHGGHPGHVTQTICVNVFPPLHEI